MTTLNEVKSTALETLTGTTGKINELECAWLISEGYSGTLNEMWSQLFAAAGFTGKRNQAASAWLESLGYTGTLNEQWYQYWAAGGGASGIVIEGFKDTFSTFSGNVSVLMPDDIVVGEMLLMCCGIQSSLAGTSIVTPTGFTPAIRTGSANSDAISNIYYRVATGTDPAVNINWGNTAFNMIRTYRISGVNASTPFGDTAGYDSDFTTNTTHSIPVTVTSTIDNSLVFGLHCAKHETWLGNSAPNWTLIHEWAYGSSTGGSPSIFTQEHAVARETDAWVVDASTSPACTWSGSLLVVQP